jgi:hypothetical protein
MSLVSVACGPISISAPQAQAKEASMSCSARPMTLSRRRIRDRSFAGLRRAIVDSLLASFEEAPTRNDGSARR